jgi:hypothetical protein
MRSVNSIFDFQNAIAPFRSYVRLRMCAASLIKPQLFSTDIYIGNQVVFLQPENWLADWRPGDFDTFSFLDDFDNSDFGTNETVEATLSFRSYYSLQEIRTWYIKNLKSKRITIELTDDCNIIQAFNPFIVGMKLATSSETDGAIDVTLNFSRAQVFPNTTIIEIDNFLSGVITDATIITGNPSSTRRIISTVECVIS